MTVILPATAGVYKWTDTQGNVHYGDHPPADEKVEQFRIEDESPDVSPAPVPKEKIQSEGNQSTGQLNLVPEEVVHTEYKIPENQCFDAYKGDLSSVDDRASYASNTLSDVDISKLKLLFKTLDRNWKGELVKIECFGTTNEPRQKKQYFTARMSGQWSMSGQLELEIDYHNKEKSSRQQFYWWLIEDSKLYFGDRRDIRAALKWVIDLESISPEGLTFRKKVYHQKLEVRKKVYRPYINQIQVKEIAVISRSLYLTELLYSNGLLTAMYYWRLN